MKNKAVCRALLALLALCRLLVGGVFVFSGFVKAVDPLGTTYKIEDYFAAFGWPQFVPALIPAMLLAAYEFCVGVAVLAGLRIRVSSFLAWLMMLFMTPLTLYLALANPVSDCGCFGDALVLSNWQTFGKNVVLLSAASLLLWRGTWLPAFPRPQLCTSVSFYTLLYVLGVQAYSLYALPPIDFRPYRIGTDIVQDMSIPEDAERSEVDYRYVMQKDGVEQQFGIDDYPDSTWTFVRREEVVLKEGYKPPINDFAMLSKETGEDDTDVILSDTTYAFVLVAHRLEEADDSYIDRINDLYDYSLRHGYRFLALTSSADEAVEEWRDCTGAEYPFYETDDIVLKTVVRSNPGLLLIKRGVVLNKWSDAFIPQEAELNAPLEEMELGEIKAVDDTHTVGLMALLYVGPLLLLWFSDVLFCGISKKFKLLTINKQKQDEKENRSR